jgi:hypothetical protein
MDRRIVVNGLEQFHLGGDGGVDRADHRDSLLGTFPAAFGCTVCTIAAVQMSIRTPPTSSA